jgi:hypothetical protein
LIETNYLRYIVGDPTDALKRAAGSSACNPEPGQPKAKDSTHGEG